VGYALYFRDCQTEFLVNLDSSEKKRKVCSTQPKARPSKVESIRAVLFIISKCVLHGGVKVNGLYIRERSFNTPILRKIGKHF
jgi:hypothetical protein